VPDLDPVRQLRVGRGLSPALRAGARRPRHPDPHPQGLVRLVRRTHRGATAMTTDATAALAEPRDRVGSGWIGGITAGVLGIYMAFFTPIQILLPLQLSAV